MSVRKTKEGFYIADYFDENGKRVRRQFPRKSQAEEYLFSVKTFERRKNTSPKRAKASGFPVDKALGDFLATKQNLRPRSFQKYRYVIEKFRSFCMANKITHIEEFTPDHAALLYSWLIAGRQDDRHSDGRIIKSKPKTVNFFLATIRAFFMDEVIKDHIPKSPVLHVKNLKAEKKHPEYYTAQDLKAFFAQKMDPSYRNAFIALLHTGMRIGELEKLTWNDIDLKKKLIYVRSKAEFMVKTFYSERDIPMTSTLSDLLVRLSADRKSEIYPFPSPSGCQIRERRLLEICKKISDRAGIKGRAFLHKFRHTYATQLIKRKVPIESIQKLLGHSSITETLIYAHVKSDELHGEVSLLDSLVDLSYGTGEDEKQTESK